MRTAVLADIHGNLPALRAVLGELDHDPVEMIVAAGDQLNGPDPRGVLQALRRRPEPVAFISGNGERETLAAEASGAWTARELGELTGTLRDWPIALTVEGICVCHGSPRRDDETITRLTPDDTLAEILAATPERLIVGGHTHQQMIRALPGDRTYVNAGSVGLPYEDAPGAYWMMADGTTPELRMTPYNLESARAELAATGFPDLEDFFEGSPFDPLDPDWVAALFEHLAGRGEHPGAPARPGS